MHHSGDLQRLCGENLHFLSLTHDYNLAYLHNYVCFTHKHAQSNSTIIYARLGNCVDDCFFVCQGTNITEGQKANYVINCSFLLPSLP